VEVLVLVVPAPTDVLAADELVPEGVTCTAPLSGVAVYCWWKGFFFWSRASRFR